MVCLSIRCSQTSNLQPATAAPLTWARSLLYRTNTTWVDLAFFLPTSASAKEAAGEGKAASGGLLTHFDVYETQTQQAWSVGTSAVHLLLGPATSVTGESDRSKSSTDRRNRQMAVSVHLPVSAVLSVLYAADNSAECTGWMEAFLAHKVKGGVEHHMLCLACLQGGCHPDCQTGCCQVLPCAEPVLHSCRWQREAVPVSTEQQGLSCAVLGDCARRSQPHVCALYLSCGALHTSRRQH